jgi:hypothetical protein
MDPGAQRTARAARAVSAERSAAGAAWTDLLHPAIKKLHRRVRHFNTTGKSAKSVKWLSQKYSAFPKWQISALNRCLAAR